MSRNRGFTLVELLVALAIFALLSAFAYRGLTALLDSREALARESRKWRDVALFVGRFERDLQAILNRRALGASGTRQAAISSAIETATTTGTGLSLTRSGGALQDNALAAPLRIAYRLSEGRIHRLAWPAVDAAPRAEPLSTPLLAGVKALGFRFLDTRGEWRPTWGLPGSADEMPAAVEVSLDLASGERVLRMIDLPRTP